MKAIVYKEYGGPDVLHMEDLEKPNPARDEVLISVRAVEATKSDCEMRSFKFAVSWFWLPLQIALGIGRLRKPILGNYFAGVPVCMWCTASCSDSSNPMLTDLWNTAAGPPAPMLP
jgi:NADPH:quinone reductase-like Zn-dependent oxidoreductase